MLRDKDIREPLFDFLEEMCGKIRILEEKQIGKSRADIVMVLPELAHIQELNEMPKYKEKSKQFVIDKIAERIPEDTLSKQISNALFERDYNEIEHVIPVSYTHLAQDRGTENGGGLNHDPLKLCTNYHTDLRSVHPDYPVASLPPLRR